MGTLQMELGGNQVSNDSNIGRILYIIKLNSMSVFSFDTLSLFWGSGDVILCVEEARVVFPTISEVFPIVTGEAGDFPFNSSREVK